MYIFDVLISNSRFPNTIVISDSNSRFQIKADVACFRFRFPIPIHASAISRIRESASFSQFRDSAISRFRNFAIPQFRDFAIPRFRIFRIARFRDFAIPQFRDFAIPRFHPVSAEALSREHPRCSIAAHRQRSAAFATSAQRQFDEPPYAQRGVPFGPRAQKQLVPLRVRGLGRTTDPLGSICPEHLGPAHRRRPGRGGALPFARRALE